MKKILIYTTHKAASMFLHRITSEVAKKLSVDYYSINDGRYYGTIIKKSWKTFIENERVTGCFGPIRAGAAEPSVPEDLTSYSCVLHLRDPRDVLTSLFFSHTYSHDRWAGKFNPSDEQRKQWKLDGIDNFVLKNVPVVKNNYQEYCSKLFGKKEVIFLKYEDMVLNYAKWLEEFLSAFSHLSSDSSIIQMMYDDLYNKHKSAFIVRKEDIYAHKRQITPCDHKRKLSQMTIGELNLQLRDILNLLQYAI